jgi:hypothetical protein
METLPMSDKKVHIWHTADGTIVAVGSAKLPPGSTLKVTPFASPGEYVLEAELGEHLLGSLRRTHRVDVEAKTVVPIKG